MKLTKIKFLKTGPDKYSMSHDGQFKNIVMGQDEMRKFLKKISASDVDTLPKSRRFKSYKSMADGIRTGACQHVFAPVHKLKNVKESVMEVKEANNVIIGLAKKSGKTEKEVEKLWKEAVKIAEETFDKKEKDFKEKEFKYTTGILKKMLKINESAETVNNFLNSDKSAKDFVKEAVQGSDSMGIDNTIVNKDKKKPKVVDPAEDREKLDKERDKEDKEREKLDKERDKRNNVDKKESAHPELSPQLADVIIYMSGKLSPEDLADTVVEGIMDGVAEGQYGSDDRFLRALRKALENYSI